MKIGGAGLIKSITSFDQLYMGKMVWSSFSIQSAMLNLGHPDLSCLETSALKYIKKEDAEVCRSFQKTQFIGPIGKSH